GSAGGGTSTINLVAHGLAANRPFSVGCWETSDPSGNGGSQVASFSFTTDASGNWSGSGCATADSANTNLRIGPNLIWSNTLAPVPTAVPANLTIGQGPYAGGNIWWVSLTISGMTPSTVYAVQCWQTSDPSGNGGSRLATFSVTTDGA